MLRRPEVSETEQRRADGRMKRGSDGSEFTCKPAAELIGARRIPGSASWALGNRPARCRPGIGAPVELDDIGVAELG